VDGTKPMRVINHLQLGHSYCRLMIKLVVSDAIRCSRDIYEHLSGVRQYQEETGSTQ